MKTQQNIKALIGFAALILVLASCKTDDSFLTFDSADKGAYVKLVASSESGSKSIDILDQNAFDNSKYSYSVEFIDGEGGTRVLRYLLNISYTDSTGTVTRGPDFFRTFEESEFTLSANGNLGVAGIEITAKAAATAFGLNLADLKETDRFVFTGVVVMRDNKMFSSENSSPTIISYAYFDFESVVVRSG